MKSEEGIRQKLMEIARKHVSYAVSLKVSAHFRNRAGNIDIMPNDCQSLGVEDLVSRFQTKASDATLRIGEELNKTNIEVTVRQSFITIESSLISESEDWKLLIPGRAVLKQFAKEAKVPIGRAKQLFLCAAVENSTNPFQEIVEAFARFNSVQ